MPSTSTSGPPIMRSVWIEECETPFACCSSGRHVLGAVDGEREALAVGDVGGRVLVEERVHEDDPGLADAGRAVHERDLAEHGRAVVRGHLAAHDLGALGRLDVDDAPALEA